MIKEIVERWHEENFTMIDEVAQATLIAKLEREFIAHAEVTAALEEIRGKLYPQMFWLPVNHQEALRAIDAAITKLGLAPGEK